MTLFTSCRQEPKPSASKSLPAQTFLNVSYGDDTMQRMDIYLPANRSASATKSLVLIHGGGWTSGSKADFATYIDSFNVRLPDYAIFNINYRLVNGGNLFPTQENDVKAAMNFISGKAGEYNVSRDHFSLLGFSAGAHLALLQAYKNESPKVRAVIDYFGLTDLVAMYNKPWHPLVPLALQMITGTSPANDKTIFEQSSPAYFVSEQSPPTLILHGGRDVVVNVSQSRLLAGKLEEKGVKHELHVFPSEAHGRWYGKSLTTSMDRIETFLDRHVQ